MVVERRGLYTSRLQCVSLHVLVNSMFVCSPHVRTPRAVYVRRSNEPKKDAHIFFVLLRFSLACLHDVVQRLPPAPDAASTRAIKGGRRTQSKGRAIKGGWWTMKGYVSHKRRVAANSIPVASLRPAHRESAWVRGARGGDATETMKATHSSAWFMVHGSWFMVHGSWFMVHGSWFLVHGDGS